MGENVSSWSFRRSGHDDIAATIAFPDRVKSTERMNSFHYILKKTFSAEYQGCHHAHCFIWNKKQSVYNHDMQGSFEIMQTVFMHDV